MLETSDRLLRWHWLMDFNVFHTKSLLHPMTRKDNDFWTLKMNKTWMENNNILITNKLFLINRQCLVAFGRLVSPRVRLPLKWWQPLCERTDRWPPLLAVPARDMSAISLKQLSGLTRVCHWLLPYLNDIWLLIRRVKPDVHISPVSPGLVLDDKRRVLYGQSPCQANTIADVLHQHLARLETGIVVKCGPDLCANLLSEYQHRLWERLGIVQMWEIPQRFYWYRICRPLSADSNWHSNRVL